MSKQYRNEPVINEWVCRMPFQMQALLLTGVRGPDENNKYNAAKAIVRYLRSAIMKPAADWDGYHNNNDWMWGEYDKFKGYADAFFQDHDEYPHHFIMHLVHCAEVIGFYHTDPAVKEYWNNFYHEACDAFHMNPETFDQFNSRLNDFGCGWHNGKGIPKVIMLTEDEFRQQLWDMRLFFDREDNKSLPYNGVRPKFKEHFDELWRAVTLDIRKNNA